MVLRKPILIDIRKDSIVARALSEPNTYVGEFYIWTKDEKGQKDIVKAVGKTYDKDDSIRHKIFYNNEHILIDNFEKASAALRWIFQSIPTKGLGPILKPIVIVNVPYSLTQVEINALKEAVNIAGAREFFLLNEPEMPSDRLFEPNLKLPGKIIYGEDRYRSDEILLVGFICFFVIIISMIFWKL